MTTCCMLLAFSNFQVSREENRVTVQLELSEIAAWDGDEVEPFESLCRSLFGQ